MSVKVTARVWEKSKQKGSLLLLTLALADNADDNGFCFPGTAYLKDKIRMSERQTQRLIDTLIESGEVYYEHNGQGRGSQSQYFVTSGLTIQEIADLLPQYFDISTADLQNVTLSIEQKRVTFFRKKGDILGEKRVTFENEKKVTSAPTASKQNGSDINRQPSLEPSLEPSVIKSAPKKRTRKPKTEPKPSSALCRAMHDAIPEDFRPARFAVGWQSAYCDDLLKAGYTAEDIGMFVRWLYATDSYYRREKYTVNMPHVASKLNKARLELARRWSVAHKESSATTAAKNEVVVPVGDAQAEMRELTRMMESLS